MVGIKTNVYQLGNGMIEFMAIGTAVKRMPGLGTLSEQLPPQAIIKDKDTFVNTAEMAIGTNLNAQTGRATPGTGAYPSVRQNDVERRGRQESLPLH